MHCLKNCKFHSEKVPVTVTTVTYKVAPMWLCGFELAAFDSTHRLNLVADSMRKHVVDTTTVN